MFWTFTLSSVVIYLFVDWLIRLFKVENFGEKHIFITGCGSGFGKDLAIRLDKMGFPVFASCRTEQSARDLAELCSSRVKTMVLDVTNSESIQAALEIITQSLPNEKGLWAVINNAGRPGPPMAVELLTMKDFTEVTDANLFGAIEVTKTFMPLLRKSQGRLINMSSMMGRTAPSYGPYVTSKFGLEAFSDAIRREVSRFGVKVSIIEPGYFTTPLVDAERLEQSIRHTWNNVRPEIQAAYGDNYLQNKLNAMKKSRILFDPNVGKVTDAYVEAITCQYPRTRYVVGYDANFLFIPISFMPTWIGDFVLHKMEQSLSKL